MSSLFDAGQNAAALQRIETLHAEARPLWGEMGPAQMLAHCSVGLELAMGRRTMKRMLLGRILGGLVKRGALGEKPFRKGLPTAPDFVVRNERDFDAEKARLQGLVQAFQAGGAAVLTQAPHPFFGSMTPEQWDVLMWKHLDHHLSQFDV